MFDKLSDKLDKALHNLKGHGKINEINVAETMKEVRRALLDADVNFKIAKEFTNTVKEKALGQNVLTNLKPGQLMVKIVKDELTELMGGDAEEIDRLGHILGRITISGGDLRPTIHGSATSDHCINAPKKKCITFPWRATRFKLRAIRKQKSDVNASRRAFVAEENYRAAAGGGGDVERDA